MRKAFCSSVLAATLLPGATGLVVACGTLAGSPGGSTKTTPSTPQPAPAAFAPVSIAITDAPIDDVQSAFVTVIAVELTQDGTGWTEVPLATSTEIDLLQYQGGQSLGLAALDKLAAGTYASLRLKLDPDHPPRLVEADGTVDPLTIPSANASGIKVDTPFTVTPGQTTKLTIDFDLRKSIKAAGNGGSGPKYILNPVLRLVADDGAGTVTGTSAAGGTVCLYAQGATKDDDDGGEHAETCGVVRDGKVDIGFVPAGLYEVRVFPVHGGNGKAVDAPAVTVTAGQTADMGALPL
jgi:hypothetical protein